MANKEYYQLILSHQSSLYAFIRSLVPAHVSVDDILQETNLTLMDKEDTFELGTDFKSYAFKIARFKVLSQFRDSKRNSWLLVDSELSEELISNLSSHPLSEPHAQEALRRCLKKLPENHRQLVEQRYWIGHSLKKIAKAMKRSEGSLQQLFFRIRQQLKSCIEAQ